MIVSLGGKGKQCWYPEINNAVDASASHQMLSRLRGPPRSDLPHPCISLAKAHDVSGAVVSGVSIWFAASILLTEHRSHESVGGFDGINSAPHSTDMEDLARIQEPLVELEVHKGGA